MQGGWLPDMTGLPIVAIGLGTFAAMLVGAYVGGALRRVQAKRAPPTSQDSDETASDDSFIVGSVLGTLGLLLAFSFGMVINRYEDRRQLVVQEANAIGTAYLRAQLLDEPYRSRLSNLLVEYTSNRISLASAEVGPGNPYLAKNDRLLTELWATVKASRESALSHGLTTTLLATFNEVIDLDTERKVAWDLRLPPEVLALLTSFLIITSVVIGYQVPGRRGQRLAFVLFGLLALSIAFIADINRPMSGQSRESQKPMLMLLQSLRSQPPQAFDQPAAADQGTTR